VNQSRTQRIAPRERYSTVARVMLAIALLVGSALSMIQAPVVAQSSALLSVSALAPSDSALWAETRLDSSSDQMVKFDALLMKLGASQSLTDEIQNASDPMSGLTIDLEGAEVGIALRASALTSASSTASEVDASGSVSAISAGVTNAAESASNAGTVLVIKPTNIETVKSRIADAGSDSVDSAYKTVDIYLHTDAADGTPTYYAVVDNFVVLAGTVDDLHAAIDASTDPSASLAANPDLAKASGLLPQERVAFGFADGPALITAAGQGAVGYESAIADTLSAYKGSIGLAVVADDPGIRFEMVTVPADGARSSSRTGADLDLSSKVPADTAVFASGYDLGSSTVLKGLGVIVAAAFSSVTSNTFGDPGATPAPFSVDDLYSQVSALFGFNLKTEFLDQMTGPYGFALWGIDNADPSAISAVLTSNVGDSDAVSSVVATVALLVQAGAQGKVSVKSIAVEGGSVNNVTFMSSGSQFSVDFGLVGDQFMVGLGDGVRVAAAGSKDSLADSDIYQTAFSYLPSTYDGIYFANLQQLQSASSSAGSGASGPGSLIDNIVNGTPAASTPAQSFAAVSYVKDGLSYTSAIVVVP
jgi:hypothetical protein